MSSWRSPHLDEQNAVKLGVDNHTVAAMRRLVALQTAAGVTPLFSLRHLSHLADTDYRFVRAVVARTVDPYRDISFPKKSGGSRAISAPSEDLLKLHRWMLANVLSGRRVHAASFAYEPGGSIVECARRHVGARWMIKMDLHDFFGFITENRVFRHFQTEGYSNLVAFELARLCTRPRVAARQNPMATRYNSIHAYAGTAIGVLPQGAPTSGALANRVAWDMDSRLWALAADAGAVFTRYSDDITFSFGEGFRRSDAGSFIRSVYAAVRDNRFVPHLKKTRVIPPGARHVVLGLNADSDAVRLLSEFKRRIEVHIRGVRLHGPVRHARHREFQSVFSMVEHVDGLISFAIGVEGEYGRARREDWQSALDVHKYLGGI